MAKERTHTTLSTAALSRSASLMKLFGMEDLNELLEKLILDEYERRHGPLHFTETVLSVEKTSTHAEDHERPSRASAQSGASARRKAQPKPGPGQTSK